MQIPHRVLFYRSKWSPLQKRALLRNLLHYDATDEENEYPAGDCMVIWLAHLLEGALFLKPEQRQLLLEEITPDLQQFGKHIEEGLPEHRGVPNYQLVLAEGYYATWTNKEGFLDLREGTWVRSTPRPILESLGYNLTELFCRRMEQCLQIQDHLGREDRDASDANAEGPGFADSEGGVDPRG